MIIVEGPDGCGKTLLAKQLSRMTSFPIAPRVVSEDAEAMVDLVKWTNDNLKAGWQSVIFDRHRLISEPIYGPILRGELETGFDNFAQMNYWLDLFYRIDPIIIYCLPPMKTMRGNVMGNPANRIYHDHPQRVNLVWGAYFNKAITEQTLRSSNTYMYDYTAWMEAHMLAMIEVGIRKRLRRET